MKRTRLNNLNDNNEEIGMEEFTKNKKPKRFHNVKTDSEPIIIDINSSKTISNIIKKNIEDNYKSKPEFNQIKSDNINQDKIKLNKSQKEILSKLGLILNFKVITPLELYYKTKYEEFHKLSIEEDKCSICQFHFYEEDLRKKSFDEVEKLDNDLDVILLENCADHFFHLECLDLLVGTNSYLKCPNCSKIYGILTGDQPDGTMMARLRSFNCKGYHGCGTIEIEYIFPNGKIEGKRYSGTHRIAYLPNNVEGNEILALLKVAFDRRLLFTVGTSVTTGEQNTTIWNGVHHKTNTEGGSQNWGYPDNTYFFRVKQELAAKGVLSESIKEDLNKIADDLLNGGEKKRSSSRRK